MGDISTQSKFKRQPGYILENIKHVCNISKGKKSFCKKAILWLLSKTPHPILEIADHFEISPELVQSLIDELIRNNRVVKLVDSDRYRAF